MDSDDSDDETDETNEPTSAETKSKRTSKARSERMREVTYSVFEREIWPKIRHKTSKEIKCHPHLVWKEFASFIKGSHNAVIETNSSKARCLSKEEYIDIGQKRAPDFDRGDREVIYELFKLYEKRKKEQYLFDEMDVVRCLGQR